MFWWLLSEIPLHIYRADEHKSGHNANKFTVYHVQMVILWSAIWRMWLLAGRIFHSTSIDISFLCCDMTAVCRGHKMRIQLTASSIGTLPPHNTPWFTIDVILYIRSASKPLRRRLYGRFCKNGSRLIVCGLLCLMVGRKPIYLRFKNVGQMCIHFLRTLHTLLRLHIAV